jgi:Ig-like domain CHU_C associated/PKD-like domain
MKKNYFNSGSTLSETTPSIQKLSFVVLLFILFLSSNSLKAQIALRGVATTASSTNTNITINKPVGVVLGDIMLVTIAKGGNRTTDPSLAGWTLIDGVSLGGGTQRNGAVLYKIATAAEPANYTFSLGFGTNSASGGIVSFSGVNTTTPFDVGPGTISVQPNQTGVDATSITTVTANTAIIMFGQAAGSNPTWNTLAWNTTSPGGLTELFDVGQGSNDQSSAGAAWKLKPTIGATGNGSATLSFAERNGGILVALRPACSLSVAPTSIAGTTTICSGSSTTLTVSGGTLGVGATAQWFTGSCGGTAAGTGNSITVSPSTNTTYYVRYSGICNTTTCASVAVTVNALSVAPTSISGTTTICNGNSTTLTLAGGTAGTGATAQWFTGSCGGTSAGTGNSITVSPSSTTTYFVRYSGTCNTTTCASVIVNVNTVHAITLQPIATQTVCSDSSVSFSVNTSGSVTSYQWYKGATLLTNGGSISGATSATLSISPISLLDVSSNYYCVVSGNCASPINSNAAELLVNEKVTIVTQPQATQTLCAGTTATFSVVATGTGLSYQWHNGGVPLLNGGTISGATSSTLSISSLSVSDSSNNYYCVVGGTSPCGNLTSNNAILIVNSIANITTQPQITQSVCANSSINFFITASGGGLSYQWYKGATMLLNGGAISGATTNSLTINTTSPSDSATDYYCVVSNNCTVGISSNNAELIVNETPIIPNQSLSICSEDSFSLNLVNGIPTLATIIPTNTTYTWPAPVVTGGITGGTAGVAQTTISQTLDNPTSSPQTATYSITPSSGVIGNCIGSSFTLVVTVNPKPFINNITSSFCSEENFSFTPTNGGGNIVPVGTTYSWGIPTVTGGMTGGNAGIGQPSINQTLINATTSDQTAAYTVTATSGICAASTFSVIVTIHTKPIVAGSILSQPICSGTAISPILLSNPNGLSGTIDYTWNRDNTVNITGIASSGNTGTISGNLTNTTDIPQTTIFTLVATSDENCTSNPTTVSVLVNPIPTVAAIPSSQTICSQNAITPIVITNPNSVSGTTFTWTRTNTVNLTGIASSGTTTSITGNLTNITNVPQTTTFTISTLANGCGTTTNTITITVNPKPTVAALPLTQTLCGSTPFTSIAISNPNSVSATTFSWTRSNTVNVTGLANSGSGSSIAGTLQNNTNSNQTVTFTILATSGSCPSNSTTVDIIVLPTPLITISSITQTRCHLQAITTINLGNSNAVAGTTYSWTRDNTINLTGIANLGTGNTIVGAFSNNTTTTQTTLFTVTALAPNGCSSTTTSSVTVYAPLVAPVINAPQTVCVLSNPSLLTITTPANGGSGVYTYQWQSSTNNVTYNNIAGATNSNYQPPFVNGATVNTYYRLITTNVCGSVTSNVIFIEVVSSVGFTFGFNDGLAGPICSGSTFTPTINNTHFATSAVRFSWTADPTYISPASGGLIGTTGGTFIIFGTPFRISAANIGPLTVQNTTNATVVTSVTINPDVYNFPGPPTGSFICTTSPQIFNVTIRPIPVASATGNNTTICNGSGAGIVVNGNITDATTSYTWTRNNTVSVTGTASGNSGNIAAGGTFSLNPTLTNMTAISQIVQFTITPSSNGCGGSPIVISITVMPTVTAGVIAANQTICSGGDPVAFSQTTAATGLNLTYQWQSSIDNTLYTDINLATGNTYDSGSLVQNTWFKRVVTSTVNGTTCSASATLLVTVNTINPGSISGNQTICNGGNPNAFTSVAATGAGIISYQWQSNTTGCGGSWTNIAVATSSTYDVPAGLAVTTYYRRIAFSTLNSIVCNDFSNCIVVSVNSVTGGTVGSDQTLCGTNPAAFTEITSATVSGTISYQWQSNTTGCGGSWTNIAGATTSTYDAPAGVVVTTYYQRVTFSTLNSVVCSASSNCIIVTANAITSGTISGNRTICNGGDPAAFTVSVAATGTNLTYQWQISTTTSAGPWSNIFGEINATYDAPGPITQTTYYRRIATATVNSTSCSATSNFVTVFVNSVTASVIDGNQTICGATEDPIAFTIVSPATGNGTLSYQWQSNTTGCGGSWANISGATSAAYDAPNVLQTTYYRVIVTSTLNSILCTAISNCITITSLSKIWSGVVNTDWNNGANWSPIGVPTINDCVVIPNVTNDPIIAGTNYNAFAKSLDVLGNGELELNSNNAITVSNVVNVNTTGTFFIQNNASLVQVNNVSNIGKVTIERITQPMYRFDYTYWGSPVTLASNFTLGMLSPNTLSDKYFSWIPSVANNFGNWFFESAATIMNPIKGYILRAPQSFSFTPNIKIPYTANFIGTPNNGDILCPIYFGGLPLSNNNDKYNLLGNPYASAIDAELFLSDPANIPIIDGTIYFWTHNSPPSALNPDPFYGDYVLNYAANDYASWNKLGGTGTTSAAGSGGSIPTGFIASGQGFFTKSTGTATNGNPVFFKNSMRVTNNNNQFFRSSVVAANSNRSDANTFEKHRIWLNLLNNGGSFNQIIVGYAEGASNDFDRDFDGVRFTDNNSITLYSVIPDKHLVIQGRALPFSNQDQIPLGYKSTLNDTFSIRIDHFDELFENQNIYLEDRLLNTIHDLKQSPYSFASGIGTFDDRFVLRYTTTALSSGEFEISNDLISYFKNEKLVIASSELMNEVDIFDISGKLIQHYSLNIPKTNFESHFNLAEGIYILKVKFQNGLIASQKLIYKK